MNIIKFLKAVSLVMEIGEEAIIYDGLTGFYRREEVLRRGKTTIKEALKHGSPVSVVMIDLDEMKRLNDAKGHDEGDRLLRRLANFIRKECRLEEGRNSDLCGRYGGDEFLIIMSSNVEGAKAFLSRLRAKSDADEIKFSYGIAEVFESDLKGAITAADGEMFRDKRRRKKGRKK